MQEVTERPPLKPWDGTPLLPWKTNTRLRRHLFDLSEIVPIMLQIEAALGDADIAVHYGTWPWHGGRYIQLTPADDAEARRVVGKLIRAFKAKPKIKKTGDAEMESEWTIACSDMTVLVTVKGYKPKTCRYVETVVEVPAQEARTEIVEHAAVPASTTIKRVLVCDDAAPEAEETPENKPEEVPF
jgi:hypothetical protein